MNIFRQVLREFSWKHNPTSILWQAGSLFILAMCFQTHYALLQGLHNHDWVYLWIEIAGLVLLMVALSPIVMREMHWQKYVRAQTNTVPRNDSGTGFNPFGE